jgi:hypothetical protein
MIMKKMSLTNLLSVLRACIVIFILALISLFLFSFTVQKMQADFLKELGINKTEADKKISGSILGGYLDAYGARSVKNIALGNRTAVAADLLNYVKQYVNTVPFKNEYSTLKESHKPVENKPKTPEQIRQETIDAYKKSVAQMEETLKKADANTKPVFEKMLVESKKYLKDAEDPKNESMAGYANAYPGMVEASQAAYAGQLKQWEAEYPANHILFVKQRLQQFLEETRDIDYAAQLTNKNGKQVFLNPAYEKKSNRWKMAYRAGKEVVEPAREFVQQWVTEIK